MNFLKNSYFLLLAAIVLLLSSFPFLQETFFRIHDYTHVARIVELTRSLQAGHFPVQWSGNFGFGYGMPLFLFYGPLPFYLGSFITFLGISAVNAMKLTFLIANLLAFSGMYTLMKRWGRTVGLLSATAFLWAPYRALDIFVRGALSEVFALSLLPWILHFALLIPKNNRVAWLGISASVAALLLTHNLTAFIALPLLFALSLFSLLLQRQQLGKRVMSLITAYLAGAGLSAFYLIPLLLEKDLTIVNEITSGYFDFRIHFLSARQFITESWGYAGSSYGPDDGISFHLGRIALVVAGITWLGALFRLVQEWRRTASLRGVLEKESRALFLIGIAAAFASSLFLTLGRSQPIWESLPFFSYLQFPWRYLTVAILFQSMLVGLSLTFIRSAFWRWTAMLVLAISIVVTQYRFHQPERYLETDEQYYFTDAARIRTEASEVLFDYLPKTFNRALPPVNPDERILVNQATPSGNWVRNTPTELSLEIEASAGARIRWNIAHFPGWSYTINESEIDPVINSDGLAEYTHSAPLHRVGARFTPTPTRRFSNVLSLLTMAIWITVAFTAQKRFQKGLRA